MSDASPLTPQLTEFIRYTTPRPKRFLFYSACLEAVYWVLLPMFVFGVYNFYILNGFLGLFSMWFALFFAVVELTGRLRRRFRVNTAKALERATRQPILYLRSFYYENPDGRPETKFVLDDEKLRRREKENDDEVLALALRGVGPLVAVGKPGVKIPPLGAHRLYFSHEEWQQQVKRLVAMSQFVIIQPGYSDGTEWEIAALKEMLPPEKIIFSFLSWQRLKRASRQVEYELFAMQIKRLYDRDLPPKLGNAYFLCFDDNWQPRLVGIPVWQRPFFWLCSRLSVVWTLLTFSLSISRFRGIYRLFDYLPTPRAFRRFCVPGVREALRPILKQRGVRVPVWRTAIFVLAVLLGAFGLWSIRNYYQNPLGDYHVVAYNSNNNVAFSGDLSITTLPFDGAYQLQLAPDFTPPGCDPPATGAGNVTGALRGAHVRSYFGDPYLRVSFNENIEANVNWDGQGFSGYWQTPRDARCASGDTETRQYTSGEMLRYVATGHTSIRIEKKAWWK
ncbi:MAG TPA: hypothetical protein VGO96_02575 [Pyrinomonadaceae bacterium]|jgi:hypothetical protein|nr:hypothetical protein [Pyrinomonadaceae bacterium]